MSREGEEKATLFVGDTLFAGSIGRTDLPGGDLADAAASIREVLFSYPDDTVVWSGHGEPTTIGRERTDESEFELRRLPINQFEITSPLTMRSTRPTPRRSPVLQDRALGRVRR